MSSDSFTKVYTLTCFLLISAYVVAFETTPSKQSKLKGYAEETIERLKLKLHNALEEVHIRRTRSFSQEEDDYEAQPFTLGESNSTLSAVAWSVINVDGDEIAFVATSEGEIAIYDEGIVILFTIPKEETIYSILAFQHGNGLWLISLQYQYGMHFIRVYFYNNETINPVHEIDLLGKSIAVIVNVKNEIYLPLVSSTYFNSTLNLFIWRESRFDLITTLSFDEKCETIAAWEMYGILYIALSLHHENQLKIFHFSEHSEKLNFVQHIEGYYHAIKHFEVAGNHYIVCGGENKIAFYWWFGDHFMKQQETCELDPVVDISVLSLSQEIITIVIVKSHHLEYYFQDSSSTYVKSKQIENVSHGKLKSAEVWKDGDIFYLLPVFHELKNVLLLQLDIKFPNLYADKEAFDNCTLELEKAMSVVDEGIKRYSKVHDIWSKKRMTHIPRVFVEGAVISNHTAKIAEVSFINKYNLLTAQSVSDLSKKIHDKIQNLELMLKKTFWKSRYQIIKGNINFVNGIKGSSITVGELASHLPINGVNTSSLSSILKKNGSQTFPYRLGIPGLHAKRIETEFLNSRKIKDYLLLNDDFAMIEGHYVFKDIFVDAMKIRSNMLNDVVLSDIVTSSSPQNITCRKAFEVLSSKSVTTNGNISQVNMTELKTLVSNRVTKKPPQTSDIIFEKLTLRTINGINLTHLISDSVKRLEYQKIKGVKLFSQPLNINGILTTYGNLNKIYLDNLMTLHTRQVLNKDIAFSKVLFKEIKTHLVNGIDLCKEAVPKSGNFRVNNKVRLLQPLTVYNIIMKDGVSINTVDPSNEMFYSIFAKDLYNSIAVSGINVLNNVEIADAKIRDLLNDLLNNVWLKSKSQEVPYAHFNHLAVPDLMVGNVNGIPFTDIVLSAENVTIDSVKQLDHTDVQLLSIRDGKTLNNIDFTSKSLVLLEKQGNLMIADMTVKGNLNVPALNHISISDLMQVQALQECNGLKNIDSIFLEKLVASELNFDKIYNITFMKYMSDIVHLPPKKHITNKMFISLIGNEVHNKGLLNGKIFEKIVQSVVTLNSYQTLTSHVKFLDPLQVQVLFVKDFIISNLFDVVFTDEPGKNISSKEFKRIFANKAELGIANGVNVSNLQNAFFKSANNQITEIIKFESDLKASKIQVQSPVNIDGVNLNDIINISDTANATFVNYQLNLSTIYIGNICIYGKINGCDLSDLDDYLKRNITVKSKKYFITLNIDGNLHVESILNGLSKHSLSSIASVSFPELDIKGSLNFSDLNVTHFQVLNIVNGIDVDFLLEDAVMHQKPQDIKGSKVFKDRLIARIASMNFLNVTYLNEINMPLLFLKYLSKQDDQKISLRLQNINAFKVLIYGTLNGINLPEDVILVDTSDNISFAEFANETSLLSDIYIAGMADGVQLSKLIYNRVSLTQPQNMSSTLIFLKDVSVKGNFDISNSVNRISLNNILNTSTKEPQPAIQGNKTFIKTFSLNSQLDVEGDINGFSLESISESVYRSNHTESSVYEDTVPLQIFQIQTSALDAKSINNISIEALWNDIDAIEEYTYDKLDNLTAMINSIDNHLRFVHSGSTTSLFAFFELHQVLNVGHTLRFLPVYEPEISGDIFEPPAFEMIVWVDQNKTCRNFKSLVMKVQSDGSLKEEKKVNGRIFPFSLRILEEDVVGFSLHVDRTKRCTLENQKPDILKTILIDDDETIHEMPSLPGAVVLDAQLLETNDGIYIVIAYELKVDEDRMYVYKYNFIDDSWDPCETFHSSEVSSFDIFLNDSKGVLLAVTGTNNASGIYLYTLVGQKFGLKSSIPRSVSSSALWIRSNRYVFLILAKEYTIICKDNIWIPLYTEPVEVYALKNNDLTLDHEIHIYGISSFDTFELDGEMYVLAVSVRLQTIYVLQHRGYNGFQVIQEIAAPGVVSVTVFSSTEKEILLAIGSRTGHTRILKCVEKGTKLIHEWL